MCYQTFWIKAFHFQFKTHCCSCRLICGYTRLVYDFKEIFFLSAVYPTLSVVFKGLGPYVDFNSLQLSNSNQAL